MPKKRRISRALGSFDDILYPELKIKDLKIQIAELQDQLKVKVQQNRDKNRRITEQSKIIEKLTGINTQLIDENKSLNLKGILANIPAGDITYSKNAEIIEQCCIEADKQFILFCEGSRKSLDYKIYSVLYPTGMVIPSGDWTKIEQMLKAYRKESKSFYAIIDGDKRGEKMRTALRQEGIFCLEARAVENLMFVDEIFINILETLKIDDPYGKLRKLKEAAIANYEVNEDGNIQDKENILLIYPPKKILGLALQVIQDDKLAGYFDVFLKNLNSPEVISILKKYTPSVINAEKEKSLDD